MSPTRSAKKTLGPVALLGGGVEPTLGAAALLETADVVVTSGPLRPALAGRVDPAAEVVDSTGRTVAETVRLIVAAARAGRSVVRVLAGDPFSASPGPDEAEALSRAKVPFDVVPGVSTLLSAAAYAGVPTASARNGSAVLLLPELDSPADWAAVATPARTIIATVTAASVGKLAARLAEAGRSSDTPAVVTWAAGTPDMSTVTATLEGLEAAVAAAGRDDPGVVVVGSAVRLRDRLSWFETKPLFGWQVLVPRTREQAGALSEKLRSYGAVPAEVPTIAVEPPRTSAPMDRAVKGLVAGRYQWCVFTSTNAVRAVREKFEEVGLDSRAFAGVKLAVVGEATGAALLAWGMRAELTPSGAQSSEGLLEEFPPYDDVFDPIDRVLLPRADIATETLVAGLKERGWAVDDVTAYRTVRAAPPPAPIRDAIKGGGYDAVLFTSSSTVRNLVGIAGKPHASTVIACIGPATARTAAELGLRVDVESPEPSVGVLAAALAAFALERRGNGLPPRPAARAPKPVKVRKPAEARRSEKPAGSGAPPAGRPVPAEAPAGSTDAVSSDARSTEAVSSDARSTDARSTDAVTTDAGRDSVSADAGREGPARARAGRPTSPVAGGSRIPGGTPAASSAAAAATVTTLSRAARR